jgi:hypothetical protein
MTTLSQKFDISRKRERSIALLFRVVVSLPWKGLQPYRSLAHAHVFTVPAPA